MLSTTLATVSSTLSNALSSVESINRLAVSCSRNVVGEITLCKLELAAEEEEEAEAERHKRSRARSARSAQSASSWLALSHEERGGLYGELEHERGSSAISKGRARLGRGRAVS